MKQLTLIIAGLTILLSNPYKVFSQIQIGQDIDGELPGSSSGYSVTMNGNGNIVAIGAPFNNDIGFEAGHTRVYKFNDVSTTWEQLGEDIDAEANKDRSGWSVDLSMDGYTVVIGSIFNTESGDFAGSTRIYKYNLSTENWFQLGQDIDAVDAFDQSGYSVSINAIGNIVAIGAPFHNVGGNSAGHTRIYEYNESTTSWIQRGQDIEAEQWSERFGWSVSINNNGDRVAIGAPYNDNNDVSNAGQVRIYNFNSELEQWEQVGQDLEGLAEFNNFGDSIGLNGIGDTVIVGGPGNDENGNNSGYSQVYKWDPSISNWMQLGQNILGADVGDILGSSVAINENGTVIGIGSPGNDDNGNLTGSTSVFYWNNDTEIWQQLGESVLGESNLDSAGTAISLNANGNLIAIGSHLNDGSGSSAGHVRVFQMTANQQPQITCPENLEVNTETLSCEAFVTFANPIVTDDSGMTPEITLISGLDSENFFPIGITTVVYQATDNEGLTSTCSFTVTVIDNESPQFSECPSTISVEADENSMYEIPDYIQEGIVQFSDNCSNNLISTQTPVSGTLVSIGNTTIEIEISDEAGNSNYCSFDLQTTLSIESEIFENVVIYPNPATTHLTINGQIDNYELYDLAGRKVAEGNTQNIDVSNLNNGVYFIRVSRNLQAQVEQFIIRR